MPRAPAAAAGPDSAILDAIGGEPADVPSFFIDSLRIPVFLLPIYQAAGIEYGVRWEILAAINEIETDYGRNLAVSSAGARGWMQFMPATWKNYGVDANRDGRADPYNPVDAIFAAGRYLEAAGAQTDLRKALFAYNHADWYVDVGAAPRPAAGRAACGSRRRAVRTGAGPAAGARATDQAATEVEEADPYPRPEGEEWCSRRSLWPTARSCASVAARGSGASSSCATSSATPTRTAACGA